MKNYFDYANEEELENAVREEYGDVISLVSSNLSEIGYVDDPHEWDYDSFINDGLVAEEDREIIGTIICLAARDANLYDENDNPIWEDEEEEY